MDEQKDPWVHKDLWRRFGKDFMVEVSRHTEKPSGFDPYAGEHKWAVYAWIYPKHPRFAMFKPQVPGQYPDMTQEACYGLLFHSYCSLLRYHRADPKKPDVITAIQVGDDYGHLHDDHYSHLATRKDAYQVFSDADLTFGILQEMSERAAHQPTEGTPE